MSDIEIPLPPGITKEQFEEQLEQHVAKVILDSIVAYLKKTADIMDEGKLDYMTASDIRCLALELAVRGYPSSSS